MILFTEDTRFILAGFSSVFINTERVMKNEKSSCKTHIKSQTRL